MALKSPVWIPASFFPPKAAKRIPLCGGTFDIEIATHIVEEMTKKKWNVRASLLIDSRFIGGHPTWALRHRTRSLPATLSVSPSARLMKVECASQKCVEISLIS